MIHKLVTVLLVCSCATAWGQAPVKSPVLIKAGKLLDVRNGRMLTNQAILIEGDRIKEVGDSSVVTGHAPSASIRAITQVAARTTSTSQHSRRMGYSESSTPFTATGGLPSRIGRPNTCYSESF